MDYIDPILSTLYANYPGKLTQISLFLKPYHVNKKTEKKKEPLQLKKSKLLHEV